MKTAGIIGGFGPQTTAKFYEQVFFACQRTNPGTKAHILISSVPLPFQIESNAILKNEGVDEYLPYLENEAQRLEKAGADFLILPCNSLHIHIRALRACVSIPMLSIIDETAHFLVRHSIQSAAILSTAMTARHRLYENELTKYGIHCAAPDEAQQQTLNQIVFHLVNGENNQPDRDQLSHIIRSFLNVDCILLACTDLQLLELESPDIPIFDTMQILADSTVREICTQE